MGSEAVISRTVLVAVIVRWSGKRKLLVAHSSSAFGRLYVKNYSISSYTWFECGLKTCFSSCPSIRKTDTGIYLIPKTEINTYTGTGRSVNSVLLIANNPDLLT